MKRFLKYFGVWLVMMLASFLIARFGIIRSIKKNILIPSIAGYSERMTFPLPEPKNAAEEKEQGGTLRLRELLCNGEAESDIDYGTPIPGFSSISLRESYVFLNPEGEHRFSYGIYAYVYHRPAEDESISAHPIGLIDVGELADQDGAAALLDALRAHPDAEARLDSYSVQERLVQPARITLTGAESGETLFSQDFAAEGEIISAEDALILNSENVMAEKLSLAMQGERDCDKKAAEAAMKVLRGEDPTEERVGLFKDTDVCAYNHNGYRMIICRETVFWKLTAFYTLVIGAAFTLLLLLVFIVCSIRKAKRKK